MGDLSIEDLIKLYNIPEPPSGFLKIDVRLQAGPARIIFPMRTESSDAGRLMRAVRMIGKARGVAVKRR